MLERYRFRDHRASVPMTPAARAARDAFIAEHGGRDALRDQPCYLCEGRVFEPISEIDRYGFHYPTGLCIACGMVQQTAYYSDAALGDFYASHYRRIYGDLTPGALFQDQRRRGIRILAFAADALSPGGRVAEIGTGAGGILSRFADAGHAVLGLDYDPRFLRYGAGKGLDLREGGLDALGADDRFDLIIISHVLEHVTEPREFLRTLGAHLTREGALYIEVPSLDWVRRGGYDHDLLKYFQNAHTTHYSLASFGDLCALAGFRVLKATDRIRALVALETERRAERPRASSPEGTRALLDEIERRRRNPVFRARIALRAAVRWGLDRFGLTEAVRRLLRH